jgi:hypothetical protein
LLILILNGKSVWWYSIPTWKSDYKNKVGLLRRGYVQKFIAQCLIALWGHQQQMNFVVCKKVLRDDWFYSE